MPRGGGFRGGGFRGGGFRGGGFRGGGFGGGFRGGGFGGGFRGGGRPFGRTGATRITSRSPSGPYRHRYYRPHRRYYRPYWWYHRPWYWRWWYSPWWAGHWYRPWYYSPVYVGGGIIFIIILALIILPVAGVAFWFPFSNTDADGYVNYRSTETLYYNEFWYEYEYMEAGGQITFSVQSSPSTITFAIWNQPFESLPTTTIPISVVYSTNLLSGAYWFEWLFLRPGSLIEYDFNASGQIDFFIADANDFYIWDQGGFPSFLVDKQDTNQSWGQFPITIAQDYFLIWYNEGGSSIDVNYTIDYSASNVINFIGTPENEVNTTSYSGTYSVTTPGNWYFFIYFDPMNSPEESTTITFDVSYDTGVTYQDKWIDIQWILIIVLAVIVIILIAAVIARRGQKKLKLKEPTTPEQKKISPYKTAPPKAVEKELNCTRCNAPIKPDSKFCPKCGGKIEGRQIGVPSITTPATAKTCSLCGSKLTGTDKFCKWCGTKVEQ
ncbi:MAG: zinc ribbon domain-containing protein [Candidatus Hodarchaeota archaeon]